MTFFYDLFKRLDAVETQSASATLNEGVVGDTVKKVSGVAKRMVDKVTHGSDADMIRDLQRKMGVPETGKKPDQPKESMSAKQKSFAALAEPRDKITFADKIAGAKKEVDEMLGDVAAEAMKDAVNRKIAGKRYGGAAQKDDDLQVKSEVPRGRGRPKKSTDTEQGADLKPDWSAFGVGKVKLPAHKGAVTKHTLSDKETSKVKESNSPSDEIKQAIAMLKKSGYKVTKAADGAEQVDEKAVSKKQQKFMGMVHAAQKGEKPASKEVAKVAKTMKKKDAEDFAATKHEGLPEKKKSDSKKKSKDMEESSTTAGSVATSSDAADSKPAGKKKSSGSSVVGKGIYDSLNRELENMIAESMNINVSMSTDAHGGPQKSVTVSATDEDAEELARMLSHAGVNMAANDGAHACDACGQEPCGCAEVVDENAADWPTDTKYQDTDYMTQDLAGGLNRPKTTGQTTLPVINRDPARQRTPESAAQEDESDDQLDEVDLGRLSELAGLGKRMAEADMEEGNEFSGALAKAKQAGEQQFDVDGKTYDVTEGSMDEENEMAEADSLQARLGINTVNKHPRDGQTDFRNIPAGNHPRGRNKFSDEYRSSQPDRLKREIEKSLGKHPEPNLPECTDSHAARLLRDLQQFKG
jgi:hypothetical protein